MMKKKRLKYIKLWYRWAKRSNGSLKYKLRVLFGRTHSPSFDVYVLPYLYF